MELIMTNRKKPALFVIPLLLVLAGFLFLHCTTPERSVMRYYRRHIDTIRSDVERHLSTGDALPLPKGIASITETEEDPRIIEYTLSGRGLGPSTSYCGFYYSEDDTPASFHGYGTSLTEISDSEWKWTGEGDNHGYTRRLEKNWFYFEASF